MGVFNFCYLIRPHYIRFSLLSLPLVEYPLYNIGYMSDPKEAGDELLARMVRESMARARSRISGNQINLSRHDHQSKPAFTPDLSPHQAPDPRLGASIDPIWPFSVPSGRKPKVDFKKMAETLRDQDRMEADPDEINRRLREADESVNLYEKLKVPEILEDFNLTVWEELGTISSYDVTDPSGRYRISRVDQLSAKVPSCLYELLSDREEIGNNRTEIQAVTSAYDPNSVIMHRAVNVSSTPSWIVKDVSIGYKEEAISIGIDTKMPAAYRGKDPKMKRVFVSDKPQFSDQQTMIQSLDYPLRLRDYVSHFRNGEDSLLTHMDSQADLDRAREFILFVLTHLALPRIEKPFSARIENAQEKLRDMRRRIGSRYSEPRGKTISIE
jgi:hypothetical protein